MAASSAPIHVVVNWFKRPEVALKEFGDTERLVSVVIHDGNPLGAEVKMFFSLADWYHVLSALLDQTSTLQPPATEAN